MPGPPAVPRAAHHPLQAALATLAAAGAIVLLAAEFTPLLEVHAAGRRAAIRTVTVGAHHSYALVPIAVFAAVLALALARDWGRSAAVAIAVLGAIALLMALLGDLPDADSHGYLPGASAGSLITASSTPEVGLYLETLGAGLLVIAGGCALLLSIGSGPTAAHRQSPG